jgi:signal transduction histidine kinase
VGERRRLGKERRNISESVRRKGGRDLSDGIASQLTAARLILDNLARTAEKKDTSETEIAQRIRKSRELVAESAGEVRRLSHGLNPVAFSEGKLPAALARLAEDGEEARFVMGCQSSGECRQVEIQEGDEMPDWDVCLDDETATNLYWIAQEAFNNAHKHADPDEIVIRLEVGEEGLLLSVEDDGAGFLLSEVDDEGIGLRSMKYRARGLGATFSLDSAPGAGTRVCCRFPLG